MAKVKKNLTERQLGNLKQNRDGIRPAKNVRQNNPRKSTTIEEPETEEEKRKRDWKFNNLKVTTEFCKVMIKKNKIPTTAELARITGLSVRTVDRHLEDFDYMNILEVFKTGLEPVMMNLFKQASSGKSEKMIRLFLDAIGITNKNRLDITTGGKPLPAPSPPVQGIITIDPTSLPTEVLERLIAQHDSNPT